MGHGENYFRLPIHPSRHTRSIAKENTMILGLRTAIYPAPDLAAAKRWYSKVLEQAPYFDQPFYVGFNVGGFELGLLPSAQPATAGPQPLWGVTDIEAEHARLLALEPITEVGEGIKVAAVIDPFGNRFGMIQNPYFDPQSLR
jgi:predicted enzyme related to lactoylglutathione lyase